MEEDIAPFAALLEQHAGEVAAVILEPVVQGAGGMRIYHPTYLKRVRELCDRHQVLLIAERSPPASDRTGKLFACEHAQVVPDISLPGQGADRRLHDAVRHLTTRHVAETISNGAAGCFMRRPTFMANPLACAGGGRQPGAAGRKSLAGAGERHRSPAEAGSCCRSRRCRRWRTCGCWARLGGGDACEPVNVAELQRGFVERGCGSGRSAS